MNEKLERKEEKYFRAWLIIGWLVVVFALVVNVSFSWIALSINVMAIERYILEKERYLKNEKEHDKK